MFRLSSEDLARRVAEDIPDGSYVNLGIGMPTRVANFVAGDKQVIYHSENGILGVGPAPKPGEENTNLINAGKQYVTLLPGGCYFDNAESFAMMRGGHLDIAVLGAFQVAENGDLANWATNEDKFPPAVGGAMDLAVGAKRLFVIMRHSTRDNDPKILQRCTFPLTGTGVVSRIFTDLAVLDVTPEGLQIIELFGSNTFEEVQAVTGARLLPPLTS
ncbi:3-oxoadipate CoA-transferase, beta subunit [Marinobacter sp. DSM 26671]|jgi:3-oxoacid CoA-transferase B subunit|uniref:3-oxoacid CoA-transferase subunit B n=1 Tax=unclassified Marinobacter TaxID=83889 RepID=UPI00069F6ABB|nr:MULTISPECIES: 3-oxoacid CoA-transferase subunit B [unclassified Marinobacter]AKV98155.1 3-oxoadipate CoA-transferase [Marinobacter sp. CP1]SFE42466.1 3-oxoadipate CoA-transferase, beta subunit [Marinobacter sp. DSM 26671]|tara:strand:- start:1664 stop:2311 length:648 start_codon:yes stop_codon:yes gene_type:complete